MKYSNTIKKIIDLSGSIIIFIVFAPILIFIIFIILILEGRPVFYISQRMVTSTKLIRIIKFRTMFRDATSEKYQLNERYMRNGFLDIPLECEVYTPIGRVLERTQLVEILQILNIIMGDMSFVGNRPLPKANIELLLQFPGWERRFSSPAGITGISQIAGKYDLQPSQRIYLEIMYSSIYINPNGNILLCDLLIIWHTCLLLLTGKYLGYEKSLALLIRCGAEVA
jgi:lipopolysaccharide/colanic/teichoic acid biosynthesis glycosyltransferase